MTYPAPVSIGNRSFCNVSNSFNTTFYNPDEDALIMDWLSPLEPSHRHQGVRVERFDGIGDWLLETKEFREWRGSEGGANKAVLFCSGNLGVGKTYLSSLVIDTLCDQAREEDIAVAGLYCDFLAQQEQTVTNMMGAILKQLVVRGGIPEYIRKAFREGKAGWGGGRLRLADLIRMLRIAIASLPQVFICIDALDGCLPNHLQGLLESLVHIVRETPKTRIFLTGRPHITEAIQRYFTNAVVMPISPNTDDIRHYLERKLDMDVEPEAMDCDLREDIVRITLEKMSNIFLLVSLNMDAILGEETIRERRKKLEEMAQGNGLGDAYTATLPRLKRQKGNKSVLGLKVLMWVLYSERPLRAEELCHALGVEIGSTDLDSENVPTLKTALSSCLGLVTVEASSSTVQLVHPTLREHLLTDPTLFDRPHSTIAEVCLTYLNFPNVWNLEPTLDLAPPAMPLLEYASCYWGEHTRKGMTEDVKALALKLLGRFDEHVSARLMLLHYNDDKRSGLGPYEVGGATGFTGLHAVAFLGISAIAAPLSEIEDWDVNASDCTGGTALTWAARNGNEGVVRVLLEREDLNPDQADTKYDRAPLSWAAGSGHEGVVKILLEREDINPNRADNCGQTPLSLAAENGHQGVVKILLEQEDINPNQADIKCGRTPLSWAAGNGHEGVVKTLLEQKDVNPGLVDSSGRTPLSWAAGMGHEGVVNVLLGRKDVDPNRVDSSDRTPLSWAAGNGHEGVIKVFLEREDVIPGLADSSGRTPILWATSKRDERVVKLFLEPRYFAPNQTPTDQVPPVSLRIAITVCFLITALLFLSHLLTIA